MPYLDGHVQREADYLQARLEAIMTLSKSLLQSTDHRAQVFGSVIFAQAEDAEQRLRFLLANAEQQLNDALNPVTEDEAMKGLGALFG